MGEPKFEKGNESGEDLPAIEEKKKLRDKIDQFYVNWESANLYFENREACDNSPNHRFVCDNVQSYKFDVGRLDPDAKVRAWKREYQSCGCLTNEQADYIMKDIRRQMAMF